MSFFDHFSDKADLYAAARPQYPDDLYAFVGSVAPQRGQVWDCGTGNGQAAVGLATVFEAVSATDPSPQQIAQALPHPRIEYSVQSAEKTAFAPSTFDAVCVAQALHWFDFEKFYAEVRRVLKPNGVLVAWGYDWFYLNPSFDAAFKRLILEVIRPYWAPQNALLWNGYKEIPFPFQRLDTPQLHIELSWNFPQLLAYVHSWSAVRRCMEREGAWFFEQAKLILAPLWGSPSDQQRILMPLHLLAGKL